jgi:drug/metabolite transporter (DMT)-like permease
LGGVRERAVAGIALALHFAFWISSLRYTSVAVSVLLVNTSPALVAAISYLLFRERLTMSGIVGIGLTFTGSVFLLYDDYSRLGDPRGALLALLGAFALGAYLLAGRSIRGRISLLSYVVPTYAVALVVLALCTLLSGSPVVGFSAHTFTYMVLLGLVPQALGHTSYNWALAFVPATVVSTVIVAEPFLATLLAWWILGESVGSVVIVGGLLVAGGIFLVSTKGVLES